MERRLARWVASGAIGITTLLMQGAMATSHSQPSEAAKFEKMAQALKQYQAADLYAADLMR